MVEPLFPKLTDASLLDMEFRWLAVRAKRLQAARNAFHASELGSDVPQRPGRPTARDLRCRTLELEQEENRLRAKLDRRLQRHGSDGRAKLGIEILKDQHHFSTEEIRFILAAAAPAISQRFSDDLVGELVTFYGSFSVETLLLLVLDPRSASDWISARRYFRPSSKLISSGVISLGKPSSPPDPSTLLSLPVSLSTKAFSILLGDVDAEHEISEGTP